MAPGKTGRRVGDLIIIGLEVRGTRHWRYDLGRRRQSGCSMMLAGPPASGTRTARRSAKRRRTVTGAG